MIILVIWSVEKNKKLSSDSLSCLCSLFGMLFAYALFLFTVCRKHECFYFFMKSDHFIAQRYKAIFLIIFLSP